MVNAVLRVLLVEDDEEDYITTGDLLQRIKNQEFQIERAQTYADALARLIQGEHQVCLVSDELGALLGAKKGRDLLREAIAQGCTTPIILLSWQDDPAIDQAAVQAGAADYLPKAQLNEWVIARSIRYVLERQRTLNQLRETIAEKNQLAHIIAQVTTGEERYSPAMQSVNDTIWDMAGSQTDVAAWKQAKEKLVHDALHDTLTGLPNRVLLTERMRHAIQVAQHNSSLMFAVLFIDLDRFKVINDSLGHMIGDQLLIAIAHRFLRCLRPKDTIARLGGDEFVVLLEEVKDIHTAIAVADRIQGELAECFVLEGHEVYTAASIGIAFSTVGYERPEDVLRDADIAMYRAKAQGRGRYEIFQPGMHTNAMALLQLETDLRRAVERQELCLHYQPIVSLRTRRVVAVEALVRWQHSQRGMISPAEFIPLAEETGLIVPIGSWVLRESCRQVAEWQSHPGQELPMLHVNLSGRQFSPHLTEEIRQILQETGLLPEQLKLEITETVLMENAELAITTLKQLRQLGIQLAIDDFGTGYSSLSYLHRLPIDTLKIDRSFTSKIDQDGEQLAIVRTIITLAWNLGMEVIAEGIETPKQLAQLRALRCEYGQGYLFAKPVPYLMTELPLIQDCFKG